MNTIEKIEQSGTIPTLSAMYLVDISESRGKQDLFVSQTPQKLKVLRENALIQSAVSSSRIEGVEIDQARINPVILGKPTLKNRNEEEVYGYRQALNWIHSGNKNILISENTIKNIHKLVKGDIWDAGKFREKSSDIIETYPNRQPRIRFKTVAHQKIVPALRESIHQLADKSHENVPKLIRMIAMNFDFLCIHPFRDGNGRVSRLLFLLQLYHLGFRACRYISIERVIELNKDRYYETLELSSNGWHEKNHNPWHFINFMLYIIKTVYHEFEENIAAIKSPKGAKTELIIKVIKSFYEPFSLVELERLCPGVSRDMIRKVLRKLKEENLIENLGRGPGAKWKKKVLPLNKGNNKGNVAKR